GRTPAVALERALGAAPSAHRRDPALRSRVPAAQLLLCTFSGGRAAAGDRDPAGGARTVRPAWAAADARVGRWAGGHRHDAGDARLRARVAGRAALRSRGGVV